MSGDEGRRTISGADELGDGQGRRAYLWGASRRDTHENYGVT